MDDKYRTLYMEKMITAAMIAMDENAVNASKYLLKEIPWDTLSTDEILKLIRIARIVQK